MAGNIRVTPEELRSVSAQLQNAAGSIEGTLGQIKGQVESVSGVWEGAAATQFQTLLAQWDRDAQDLHQVLMQIAANLNQAANNYEQTDQSAARGFMA